MRGSRRDIGAVLAAMCVGCTTPPASMPRAVNGVRALVDTLYCPVYGATPREWATSSQKEAARAGVLVPHLAMTAFANKWVYFLRPSEYGCELRVPVVLLGIRFVMPRLAVDSGVSADDMAAWQGRQRSLWIHEGAHATIAMRSAIEFRDSLRVLHSSECGLLDSRVQGVASGVTMRAQALQDSLDARSRRGQALAGQIAAFRRTVLAVDTTFRDSVP
jgi:predicted secreted Zn-dependent protease